MTARVLLTSPGPACATGVVTGPHCEPQVRLTVWLTSLGSGGDRMAERDRPAVRPTLLGKPGAIGWPNETGQPSGRRYWGSQVRSDDQTRPANRLADATGEARCDRMAERDRAVEYVQVPGPGDDDFGRVERSVGGVLDRARPRPSAAAGISIRRDPESVQHAIASSCSAVHQPCHTPSSLGLQLRCPRTSTRRSAPAIVLQRPRTSTPRLRHGAPARRPPDPALAPQPRPASAQNQPTTGVCTAPNHARPSAAAAPALQGCPRPARGGVRTSVRVLRDVARRGMGTGR
jgi:hypothetical protein